MALFNSGNPTLTEKKFKDTILDDIVTQENAMTVKGTMNKFGFLFLMMLGTAFYSWREFAGGADVWPLILTSVFGGLAVSIIMAFKKEWSPYLAPAYALLEGLFVGGVSAYFEYSAGDTTGSYQGSYSGIVVQAVGLTFAVVGSMFLLYKFNIIKATQRFKSIVLTATAAIGIFYLVTWLFYLGGVQPPSFLFQNSAFGIGFSIFVVALASLNLIIDFDRIEQGAAMGVPKYMEWYCGYGLLVTIVWLYIEILRLLSKLNRR